MRVLGLGLRVQGLRFRVEGPVLPPGAEWSPPAKLWAGVHVYMWGYVGIQRGMWRYKGVCIYIYIYMLPPPQNLPFLRKS